MPKPKVAFYWCASCGGCEETVVDLAEDILGVVEKVDIVLWPVAMDFKYKDVEGDGKHGAILFQDSCQRKKIDARLSRHRRAFLARGRSTMGDYSRSPIRSSFST